MDTSPVVYKRRNSGTPLSEVSWNVEDALVDPEPELSLLTYEDAEKDENATPVKKSRKKWSDQTLPRRKTRSSTNSLEDASPTVTASTLVGALLGRKDKDKGKGKGKDVENTPPKQRKGVEATPQKPGKSVVERTPTPRKRKQTEKESPIGVGGHVMYSPVEFVKEKQAMFAEIDAFELESEEEDPKEATAQHIAEALRVSSSEEETIQEANAGPQQSTEKAKTREEAGDKEEEEAVQEPNPESQQSTKQATIREEAGNKEGASSSQTGGNREEAANEEKAGNEVDR